MDDVTDLLLAAGNGDRQALESVVRRLQPDVWRFCARLVPDATDEAVQETFIRVWRSAAGFRGESSGRTWVLAIARRASWDVSRRRPGSVAPGPVPERVVRDATDHVATEDLVQSLNPDRRAAFVLTQLLGMTYAETAEICGCTIGTIRSRVARARNELVGLLGDPAGWAGRDLPGQPGH